ncbi:chaperone protein dnaJ 8, chloroplastic-like isoform X2 [Olea europaea var. sylvestris]|uniref:chaperone protein dnaJ 8, chloroplastic-like isoform X2 n=1 Tax=Olea europaea var. sylvestris TaxID=158386 RepID=UPI000C1CD1F9|nr:chaperone protein dnaJ 8, chloroplastic-like isoform X2 [Olea europaea var. sylvestris]
MAAAGCGSASWIQFKDSSKKNVNKNGFRVSCVYSSSALSDPYKTLRIQPDASESEVKKAFRKLALQRVMSNLREESSRSEMVTMYEEYDAGTDESMRGINEQDWDLWEEWMGWEGAGIRDYSSHINPYI